MSSLMKPQKGAAPWAPADDVTLLDELDRHDFPLAGLLEQNGQHYLFTVLLGEDSDLSVWAYVHVEEGEEKALVSSPDELAFDAAVAESLTDRPVLVAFSAGWKLRDWSMIDAGHEGPLTIATRFLRRMQSQIEESRDDVTHLEQVLQATP